MPISTRIPSSAAFQWLHGGVARPVRFECVPPASAKLGQMAALDASNRHISVRRPIASSSSISTSGPYYPAKAAMLANAISNAYLAESKEFASHRRAAGDTDLSGRLKELQERLRTAENALASLQGAK